MIDNQRQKQLKAIDKQEEQLKQSRVKKATNKKIEKAGEVGGGGIRKYYVVKRQLKWHIDELW